MIEIGKSYTIEQVVTPEMTARAIGSGGLEVFGTPFMMAMMEHAAMDCVQPDLPEGKQNKCPPQTFGGHCGCAYNS